MDIKYLIARYEPSDYDFKVIEIVKILSPSISTRHRSYIAVVTLKSNNTASFINCFISDKGGIKMSRTNTFMMF